MELAVIGPLTVIGAEVSLGPRDRVVLAALALRPGEVVTAERIADALWRDSPPATWAKVVQGCVMRLRRGLGPDAIETTRPGYRLTTGAIDLDVHRFEELIRGGRDQAGLGMPERAVSALTRALSLWRGAPFEDLEDWTAAKAEVERLVELKLSAEEDLLEARLNCGKNQEAAAEGLLLVSQQPLRERRWEFTALAQYRCGQQADALASIRRAKRLLVTELGIDVGPRITRLEAAILAQDPELMTDVAHVAPNEECPYKGLAVYDVEDADVFFGREQEVEACLLKLDASPVLVLAGPSGCGKSSLLRAGLVPALRARGMNASVFVPGQEPETAMAAARASAGNEAPLLVDQFEELFTLRNDREAASAWMAELADHAAHKAPVVVAIRADHLAALASEPTFAQLVERGIHLVASLSGDSLRAAIVGPATRVGMLLEPGLVDLLERDTEGEPGALPLLSYALAETWRRRDGRVLTVDGYLATGGIRAAVARTADQLYEALRPDQRRLLRSVLLRLVIPSGDGEPVRTRVSREILSDDPARGRVVDLLVRARLVIAEAETVELAHESLARAWPRLRAWLDEDAASLRIVRHLSTAAEGWDGLRRPTTELYQGVRLEAALEWRRGRSGELTAIENAFLDASIKQADSERQRERDRARRQARQNRRLRGLLGAVAVALVVAIVAAGLTVDRSREAARQRDLAAAAEITSRHVALANQAIALRKSDPATAALLAVEAYRQQSDALARSALMGTFTTDPGFMGYTYLRDYVDGGVLVPHSDMAAVVTGSNGRLGLVDLDSGAFSGHFPPPDPHKTDFNPLLKASADGHYLAEVYGHDSATDCWTADEWDNHNARQCTRLAVFDLRTQKQVLGPVRAPFAIGDVTLSDDGALVAVTGGRQGDVAVYHRSDGKLLGTRRGLPRPTDATQLLDTGAVVFDHRDNLYLGSMNGPIRQLDPTTMNVVRTWNTPPFSSHNWMFVTDDGWLVTSGDKAMSAIDLATGKQMWTTNIAANDTFEPCPFLGVATIADRIYCGSFAGRIREFDLQTGQATGEYLDPGFGSVGQLAISQDGRDMYSFAAQHPVIAHWRLDGSGPITHLVEPGMASLGGYDDQGRLLLTRRGLLDPDKASIRLWTPGGDHAPVALPPAGGAQWITDDLVALGPRDDTSELYDVLTGHAARPGWDVPSQSAVFASADHTELYVSHRTGKALSDGRHVYQIRGYDASDLKPVTAPIRLPSYYLTTVTSAGLGATVYATPLTNVGWKTIAFDPRTGARLATGIPERDIVQVSSRGALVAGGNDGEVSGYDVSTLDPTGSFPGTEAEVQTIQFDESGRLMLATGYTQAVQLYDVATRQRIGDPLPASTPYLPNQEFNMAEAWLRPDGQAVAVNQRRGIAIWSLDPGRLQAAACRIAGRNLTAAEWRTYLPDTPYHKTCPDLPKPAD